MGHLSWRAIVPLIEAGYTDKQINSLVRVRERTDGVQPIIDWYRTVLKSEPLEKTYVSGKNNSDLIKELLNDTFIYTRGKCEASEFIDPHFRHPACHKGIVFQDYLEFKREVERRKKSEIDY